MVLRLLTIQVYSDQLVIGPTHARGGTLNFLITDVPDLVQGLL